MKLRVKDWAWRRGLPIYAPVAKIMSDVYHLYPLFDTTPVSIYRKVQGTLPGNVLKLVNAKNAYESLSNLEYDIPRLSVNLNAIPLYILLLGGAKLFVDWRNERMRRKPYPCPACKDRDKLCEDIRRRVKIRDVIFDAENPYMTPDFLSTASHIVDEEFSKMNRSCLRSYLGHTYQKGVFVPIKPDSLVHFRVKDVDRPVLGVGYRALYHLHMGSNMEIEAIPSEGAPNPPWKGEVDVDKLGGIDKNLPAFDILINPEIANRLGVTDDFTGKARVIKSEESYWDRFGDWVEEKVLIRHLPRKFQGGADDLARSQINRLKDLSRNLYDELRRRLTQP